MIGLGSVSLSGGATHTPCSCFLLRPLLTIGGLEDPAAPDCLQDPDCSHWNDSLQLSQWVIPCNAQGPARTPP